LPSIQKIESGQKPKEWVGSPPKGTSFERLWKGGSPSMDFREDMLLQNKL